MRFSRSDRYAVTDYDIAEPNEDTSFLRQALAPIIEACAVLSQADNNWASYWCDKEDEEYVGYWDFQDDGQQRPKQAMYALAGELINLFEACINKEDQGILAEELRKLLGACTFLSYFEGGWVDD